MGALSNSTIANAMDGLFGGATIVIATHHRIVLSSTKPDDDGGGITEPAVNGYAPVVVDNTSSTWADTADRLKSNAAVVAFPTVTAADSPDGWGPLSYFAVLDDDTDDYLGHGRTPRFTTTEGDTPTFGIGDLVISSPGS